MKTQRFRVTDTFLHHGVCEHSESLQGDSLVVVRSDMWGGDCFQVSRAADVPWDLLKKWHTEGLGYVAWQLIREVQYH